MQLTVGLDETAIFLTQSTTAHNVEDSILLTSYNEELMPRIESCEVKGREGGKSSFQFRVAVRAKRDRRVSGRRW